MDEDMKANIEHNLNKLREAKVGVSIGSGIAYGGTLTKAEPIRIEATMYGPGEKTRQIFSGMDAHYSAQTINLWLHNVLCSQPLSNGDKFKIEIKVL